MKWARRHLILILINAVLALFVGVNICGYAKYCEDRESLESCDTLLQQDEASPAALMESQGFIQNLFSRTLGGSLKRAGERNLLSGLGGRALLRMAGPWSGLLHGSMPEAAVGRLRVESPFADTFTTPKEFYIYTLERMLC